MVIKHLYHTEGYIHITPSSYLSFNCFYFITKCEVKVIVIQLYTEAIIKQKSFPVKVGTYVFFIHSGFRHVLLSPPPLLTAFLVCKATNLNILFVFCFSPEESVTSPIFLTYLLLESLKPEWIHFSTY